MTNAEKMKRFHRETTRDMDRLWQQYPQSMARFFGFKNMLTTITYLPDGSTIVDGVHRPFVPPKTGSFQFLQVGDDNDEWSVWAREHNRLMQAAYEADCRRRGVDPIP